MSVFNVKKREEASKPAQLRRSGIVPMALVERTHHTLPLQATIIDLRSAMRSADGLGRVDISIEGETKPRKAVVKKVDLDPLKHHLLHVTFQEVSAEDQVKLNVPVVALGEPTAMSDGNVVLTQATDHMALRGKMADMPNKIEVDLTNLAVGEHIEAGSIVLPPGVELQSSPDATLFSLRHSLVPNLEPEVPTEEEAGTDDKPTEES